MHWYDHEPGAAYAVEGEYLVGGVTPNSLTRPWGAIESLRTSQFYFDTGRFFDEEIYSSPAGADLPDLLTEVKRTEAMFSEATRYARSIGVNVAAGFEAPNGKFDPTDPQTIARFRARVSQFLLRNPYLAYFALWQHESGGCYASDVPAAGTSAHVLFQQQHAQFAYLGHERRIWEAIRFGRFTQLAAEVVAEVRPGLRMVVVGWGGDRWMQFADLCLGYDKFLPPFVAFTCHDNIDASMGAKVSTPWGQLPPERERWAMPWVEGDIDECMVRQPHVETLGRLAPDALAKGCQGLLTLQWRTRDVEEETAFIAQFAWDTRLTPEKFYRTLARQAFGPAQEERMGANLGTLQRLGARWTGVRGSVECGHMTWTGWQPHFPFALDGQAARYLAALAETASQGLAEVPAGGIGDEEGAFHIRTAHDEQQIQVDEQRLGAREAGRGGRPPARAGRGAGCRAHPRRARRAIEEEVYALRPRLVANGMTSPGYRGIDGFLIAIHHLQRNVGVEGVSGHFRTLRALRTELDAVQQEFSHGPQAIHLERLDYLLATMDYVLHHDSAVLLLADGEAVEQAVAQAHAAREAGDAGEAARIAADAYARVIDAGMQQAVEAFTRKLTTRCDFGVLTTINVKVLPLYWQTLAKLTEFFPAIPPCRLTARGKADEVWLSWQPAPHLAGQHLYRRPAGGEWRRINAHPLAATCAMFLDRPREDGRYEYALTALDADGWESPRSHRATAVCGPCDGPRIVACKPFTRLAAGEALPLRVVVLSDREITRVRVHYRRAGEESWQQVPLQLRFRCSYAGTIPPVLPGATPLAYYVEAEDDEGNVTCWPDTAPIGLSWSATII